MSRFWRPERRNRRIGTKSSGYSQSNDMRIPSSWCDKTGTLTLFHQLLERPIEMDAIIYGCDITILYEIPKEGFSYGCSPADVIKLMKLIAISVPPLPDLIVFRQPTRKQRQQNPVWGRFFYYTEFGKHKGSAIVLEAQEIGDSLIWPRRMSLEDRDEFDRLNEDGHRFDETKRDFRATLTEDTIRSTLLFRTFLHELGHWADYSYKVIFGSSEIDDDYDYDIAEKLYFSRPTSEREVYAHAFADKYRKRLKDAGEIPFATEPFELPEREREQTMPELARGLSVETDFGAVRVDARVSAHDLTDEQISLKAFEFEPDLPEGYEVKKCTAILLVVEGLIALDEVKMDLSIKSKVLATPCSGQGLYALEWREAGCLVTVGTEDEECLSHRFPGLDLENKQAMEYGKQSMKLRLSNLDRCSSPSFHFILAENDDPETVDASSWYAVDQPHNSLFY